MRPRRGRAAGGVTAAALIMIAGCGTSPAGPAGAARPAPAPAALPLALSLVDPGGTSWAVVPMGGARAQEENFWQVFVRPASAAAWRLATPAGVASNGGLVLAAAGAGAAVVGFRPSQDLTFSPLAATSDAGARWAPAGLVSPGLGHVPGALAASASGRVIAVTGNGDAELGTSAGTRWSALTTVRGLAATVAGRACGLTGITAAAFAGPDTPLLGGTCAKPGRAGIFALRDGTWAADAPALPAALARRDVRVLRLGSVSGAAPAAGGRAPGSTVALLAVGSGAGAGVMAAWLAGGRWRLSADLRTGGQPVRSASLWPGGGVGLVLPGPRGGPGRGVTLAGPGALWAALPALPAGTATLARGAGGAIEALTVARSIMRAWRLGTAVPGWSSFQQVRVSIPYGSSS
jgi:hypothetical protein